MKPGHALPLTPQKRLMVFSGRSHPELAERIAERLGVDLGEIELKTFANDETYCPLLRVDPRRRRLPRPDGQSAGRPAPDGAPADDPGREARLGEADHGSDPVVPVLAPGRKAKPREPISGRLVADMLQLAGVDRVLTMDLHAGQIQGFFTIPVDHMTALQLFARHFRDLGLHGDGVVSVAPDAGRAKVAVRFAEMLEAEFAVMHKTRPAHEQAAVTEVTGRVRDKICIVGDDVTTTGGTLIAGARALREHGAREVWVYVTHALLSREGLERLAGAEDITGIVVTDTVPIDPREAPENLTVLTVSSLLAETIMNVFSDDSVSAIFGGENQLF